MSDLEAQCYICPYCYNDHNSDRCKTVDVKERVEADKALLDEALEALEVSLQANIMLAPRKEANVFGQSADAVQIAQAVDRSKQAIANIKAKRGEKQ